jgi:hypothetical protein
MISTSGLEFQIWLKIRILQEQLLQSIYHE